MPAVHMRAAVSFRYTDRNAFPHTGTDTERGGLMDAKARRERNSDVGLESREGVLSPSHVFLIIKQFFGAL